MKRDKKSRKFNSKGIFQKAKPLSDESENEMDVGENVKDTFPQKKWYESVVVHPNNGDEMKFEEIEKLRKEAKSLLDEACTLNSKSKLRSFR